jgi:hypothetical protein
VVRSLIPEALHASAFIAGGAAIAPHTASDVDVWVIGDEDSREKLFEFAEEKWTHALGGQHADLVIYGEGDGKFQCPSGMTEEDCEAYRIAVTENWREAGIRLIGVAQTAKASKPIQVLHATKVRGVSDLLSHFDISVHQWAQSITAPQGNYSGSWATLPSALPRITRWNTPATTVKRLRKLLHRYGWDTRVHPDYINLRAEAERKGQLTAFDTAMLYDPSRVTEEEIPF